MRVFSVVKEATSFHKDPPTRGDPLSRYSLKFALKFFQLLRLYFWFQKCRLSPARRVPVLQDPALHKQVFLVVSPLHFVWSLRLHNLDLDMTLQNGIGYMACCSFWTPPGIGGRVHFQGAPCPCTLCFFSPE